jgi:uncharacterized protein YcbX
MQLVGLYLYPVKGLRGVSVDALELGPRGPSHDREWLVVDVSGRFLTQHSVPRMATLSATVIDGALRLADDLGSQVLVDAKASGDRRRVAVWKDEVDALDVGDDAASWLGWWNGWRRGWWNRRRRGWWNRRRRGWWNGGRLGWWNGRRRGWWNGRRRGWWN